MEAWTSKLPEAGLVIELVLPNPINRRLILGPLPRPVIQSPMSPFVQT